MPRPDYKSYPGITALARGLRKKQTPAELRLWEILRFRKLSGYKFLRQHPIFYSIKKNKIDFYIADFYCAKLKLIIEVDGKIHEKQSAYDQERDSKLLEKGLFVFRIKNEEVDAIETAINIITELVNKRVTELS